MIFHFTGYERNIFYLIQNGIFFSIFNCLGKFFQQNNALNFICQRKSYSSYSAIGIQNNIFTVNKVLQEENNHFHSSGIDLPETAIINSEF